MHLNLYMDFWIIANQYVGVVCQTTGELSDFFPRNAKPQRNTLGAVRTSDDQWDKWEQ